MKRETFNRRNTFDESPERIDWGVLLATAILVWIAVIGIIGLGLGGWENIVRGILP